ncbi:MAG: repeat protein [Gemmataceae bacterium]|nr:repeat protein [Gemmataceae bacterium]
MRSFIPLVPLVFMAGCGRADVPKEKYFGGEPVEHWLTEIKNPDPKARKKAADVLGNVGPVDPGAIPALVAAAKDPDPRVRDAAVLGLSKIGPAAADAAPVLEQATKDKDPTVRSHAALALERVRGPK